MRPRRYGRHRDKWATLVRVVLELARVSLPVIGLFVIIPACILIFVGLSVQAFLAIVLIFQLYILSIQAEIASKQTAVYAFNYLPVLDVKTKSDKGVKGPCVTLRNSGKYPAHNLAIDLIDKTGSRIGHGQYIGQLSRKQEIDINFGISPEDYTRKSITMRVMFLDVLGKYRAASFVKLGREFVLYRAPIDLRSRGLLKLLEDFREAWRIWLGRREFLEMVGEIERWMGIG